MSMEVLIKHGKVRHQTTMRKRLDKGNKVLIFDEMYDIGMDFFEQKERI